MPDVETVFYDGHCGLCHGFVRFVARRDPAGKFEFAPLHGEHYARLIPRERRAAIPESVVVLPSANQVLVKSAAVRHVLQRMGGVWSWLAAAGGMFPVAFLDFAYDRVASARRGLFAAPADACPDVPRELRARFRM